MSRKQRREERASGKRREEKEENFSPFASIVLKEAEEKKSDPKKQSPALKPKKPSEVVQGYDPSASFADILANWERTGDPYAMPKRGSTQVSKKSFGEILDLWEGKSKAAPKSGEVKRVSPEYKATRSFGDILDQYEGKATVSTKEEIIIEAEKGDIVIQEKEEVKTTSFFKERGDDDERPSTVAWSIYGDNHPIERVEEKEEKEEAPKYERKSEKYVPSRTFAEILDEYNGKPSKRVEAQIAKSTLTSKPEEVKPDTPTFFREKGEDDERPSSVAWSIYGDNHKREIPTETKKEEPQVKETRTAPEKVEVKSSQLFQKEVGKLEVKSFEDILREKGEEKEKQKGPSLHQIRMMLPQATLDLHGLTQEESRKAVEEFLLDGYEHELYKVAIIHGKGLHAPEGEGVLKELAELICRESEYVREYSNPKAQYGGSGVLWVILKKKAEQ